METSMVPSASLSPNNLAHFGLKEMLRSCWLDLKGIGSISMASVRLRQSVMSDGHFWRVAVRSMFPLHPFEVNVGGAWYAIFCRISIQACLYATFACLGYLHVW